MLSVMTGDRDQIRPAEAFRSPSDQQLLERFVADRDESAFAALVERYGRAVWHVCRRLLDRQHDVEDAFQAVFLILSRNAASIRKTGAVGSWLYGVAYRTAVRAKQNATRRHFRERQATSATTTERPAWSEAAARELHLMLDEEMNRLADKYRAPFVLCCLEGMSKAEAAQELGWKEGTVSSRLAHARKLLQDRLARRGVTLSAALALVVLTKEAAAAAPPLVVATTVQAALPMAGPAACASPGAVSLANGVMHTLALAKLQASLALVLMFAALVSATILVASQGPPVAPEQPAFAQPLEARNLPGPEQVLAIALSPDGKKLVTAGASQRGKHKLSRLIIWDVLTAKEIVNIDGVAGIRSMAFSPDGQTIACGEFGGTLRLRDAATGEARGDLKGHQIGVNSVAFSRDGALLVSAGLDKKIKLWDWKVNKELKEFRGHSDMIFSVAFFGHGRSFVTSGRDGVAKIWNIDDDVEKFTLSGHKGGIEMVAISPNDQEVATASWDGTIRIWDAETGGQTAALAANKGSSTAVAYSPDGKLLAAGVGNGKIRVWDAKTRQLTASLDKHVGIVWGLAFTPDSAVLASGSDDSTAKLWDLSAGGEIATLPSGNFNPRARAVPAEAAPDLDLAQERIRAFQAAIQAQKARALAAQPAPKPTTPATTPSVPAELDGVRWNLWLALGSATALVALGIFAFWSRLGNKRLTAASDNAATDPSQSASIVITCLGCGKQLKAKATAAGRKAKCPQCAKLLDIPSASSIQPFKPTSRRSPALLLGVAMLVVGVVVCIVLGVLAIQESREQSIIQNQQIQKAAEKIQEQALEKLDVVKSFPDMTDQGLSRFKGMTSLRELILNNAPITDQGMKDVNTLTQLRSLSLTGTRVTDAGLAQLTDLKELSELRLDKLAISDTGLVHLKNFPKLKKLTLWRNPVTGAGLISVGKLPLLEHLSLDETQVADDGLKELYSLPNLRYISVWRSKVSSEGANELKQALPKAKVNR